MTAALFFGAVILVGGGSTVLWSWAKMQPWAPAWVRRNRKIG